MNVFCWKFKKYYYCTVDNSLRYRIKAGDVVGRLQTICFEAPKDLEPFLSMENQVRNMSFHDQIWDKALGLPSFNRDLWLSILKALSEEQPTCSD